VSLAAALLAVSDVLVRAELNLDLAEELRLVVREELARVSQSPPSPWLNVHDAAEYLATTEDAVYGLVKRQEIPVHRTDNGRLLFKRDELDTWVGDVA
jgi:excisionase family DNA binding protein